MEPDGIADEGHPVLHEALVIAGTALFSSAYKGNVPAKVGNIVNTCRCAVTGCQRAGYAVALEGLFAFFEEGYVLLLQIDVNVGVSDFQML